MNPSDAVDRLERVIERTYAALVKIVAVPGGNAEQVRLAQAAKKEIERCIDTVS